MLLENTQLNWNQNEENAEAIIDRIFLFDEEGIEEVVESLSLFSKDSDSDTDAEGTSDI